MPQHNKRFQVQIFAADGTTFRKSLTTQKPSDPALPHVKNKISFRSRINGGLGELVLDLAYPWQRFGEGTTIALNNVVDVYAMDDDHPRGRRIYRGFISKYEPYIDAGSKTGVKVTCLGLVSLLTFSHYKDGSSFTVTHTGEDPEDVFKAIIDHFNSVYTAGLLSYAGVTAAVGTAVEITFTDQRWSDAVVKANQLAGEGWWWKVDADGLCHFQAKPDSATHQFTIGKDVESINAPKSGEKIVNDIQVRGAAGATTDDGDAASAAAYGKRTKIVSDSSLADDNARTQRAAKEIADNKDPKVISPFVVNANYDLESIRVGDTCLIQNYDKSSTFFPTNMLIVGLTYDGERVRVEVEEQGANLGHEIVGLINQTNTSSGVSGGGGGGGSSAGFVDREMPSGVIDGVNTAFTLSQAPVAGSEHVFLDGVLRNSGSGNDYTISGASITMSVAPPKESVLLVSYRTASGTTNFADREVPSGAIDGINATFTLAHTPTTGSLHLYLDGILRNEGAGNDYSLSGTTIVFTASPPRDSVLLASYRY